MKEGNGQLVRPTTNFPGKFTERFFGSFQWEEFACGCGSAFINISVTYPIYKVIFRQMLLGVGLTSAFQQLRHEGLVFLYRGMLPPLAQKTISLSIMFGVFDGTRRYLVEDFSVASYPAKLIAGVVSGTAEALLIPFERVQTLLQSSKYNKYFPNTASAFRYVLKRNGVGELYRGIVPVLWRNGPSNAMFFMLREEASQVMPERKSFSGKTLQEFGAGALIGATISSCFYPFNVIKISMQKDIGHKRETMWSTVKRIYRERGNKVSNIYRGCLANSFRSFLSWGIMNTSYENLKDFIQMHKVPVTKD